MNEVNAVKLGDLDGPDYEAAHKKFLEVTRYWAPEWTDDPDMFGKMLDYVLAAAFNEEGDK